MSNLDNIISKIIEDAEKESEKIISESNQRTKEIMEKAIINGDQESFRIVEKAKKEAADNYEKEILGSELECRDTILKTEQDVVTKILNIAIDKINNLSDAEFLSYLKSQLNDIKLTDNAVLIVPDKYKEVVKNANLNIKLSDKSCKSGFFICENDIYYNNDFKDVIMSHRSEFEKIISDKLFKD